MSEYEWTVEITPTARAAISREIKAQWDGRELGGALVGHTDGERIVVTNANGIGIGVETPRGETWMRPARGRWYEFAQACEAELLGDWHCHPGGGSTLPDRCKYMFPPFALGGCRLVRGVIRGSATCDEFRPRKRA